HLKATTPVNFHGMVITIEDKAINLEAAENPASVNRQTDLVYVIYTSGSTGKPKGVMVQHDNFVNVAIAWQKEYRLQEIEVCLLQVASFSFDVFAGDLARTFLNSGKMVINPAPVLDPDTLYKLINSHRISLFESTPSYIIPFLRYVYENNLGAGIHSLKLLILGSDTCQYRDFKEAVMRFGNQMRIVNSYGVTEATIDSSYYEPLPGEDLPSSGIVPIGKPLPNVKFYILDRNGALLPLGVPGELFIGGKSIARGYLYREELTAERFISPSATGNPFEKGFPGPSQNFCLDKSFSGGLYRRGRLYKKAPLVYRTGDRARWLHNGNVEFLGRIDYQVKVRGYRIELGEIEHCILEYQDVKQAIVVEKGKESSDKYLCAYIISDKIIEPEELRRFLGQRLPDYMIPWFYVQMDRFPLTPNGKIDRNALPEPETFQEIAYVAPRNELETELVHMWTAVLAVDEKKIGIDNRFFDLGGNSLAAIILIARIHKAFNATILLEDIFRIQTIRGIAEYINDSEKTQYHAIAIAEKKEYYPLSSAQKRLYLLQQLDNESNTYNIPLIFSLQGALDKEKFVDTFKKIIQRHESFRTSFMLIKDEPVQKVHREVELQLEYYDLAEKDHEEKQIHHSIQAFVRPFDLSQAPLLRVGLLKIAGKEFILIVDMHHIISDGVSTQVLVQDFSDLYSGKYLPEINLQYKDYAEWQNREKVSKKVLEQGDYWKKQFEGEIPVLELLTDYTRPAVQTFEGSSINFEINSETTGALKNLALEAGATLYIVLAALYTVFLSRLSSQEDIIVGSPVAGRRHADLENIIGMFVNTLALRNYPSSEKKFADFLEEVKERTLKAFENQEYQYEDLVEEVVLTRDVSRNPLFDTMFLVQEAGSQKTESTGLKLIPYASEHKISKFDLTLAATEVEESLRFTFEYCTKLFKQETVERFIVYFENIIRSIAKNKNQRICDLEILPEEEKKRILFEFNDIEAEYPKNKTIHQLFTEQAERIPDNIALVGAGSQTCPICITYNQLNNQSGWLAGLLIEKGVLPNNIIGIMMERSVEMIIGLLGILKSGSAYMPIDPAYPQERIDYMLKDSAAKILINEKFFAPLFFKKAGCRGLHHSSFINHQSNLAYIIYTSGSTGRPKGVLIKHKNFVNLINFHQSIFEENQESRMSQVANPAFDAMGFEV
ncbi:MAG: hypothetical protein QG657_3118, partial [Acidobacteriota bacterium]|nr:hypothetical protein [Acidobacteriota bacterium]